MRPGGNTIFRSQNGGKSWLPLLTYTPQRAPTAEEQMAANATSFSLSPTFASDHTLVAASWRLLRSTDSGNSWQRWEPPLAFVSDRSGNRDLFTIADPGVDLHQVTVHPASDETPAWSPAWSYLAFASNRTGNWDIYSIRADCTPKTVVDEAACELRQLTNDPADDLLPAWSPDGRAIAFVSQRGGNPEIYIMASDGTQQQRVTYNSHGDWRPVWLPNARQIAFTSDRNGSNDILYQTVRQYNTLAMLPDDNFTHDTTFELANSPADERDPAITPDGRLLFWSNEGATDGKGRIAALCRASDGRMQTVFYKAPAGLVGHPSGIPELSDTRNVLVSVEQDGDVDIYGCGQRHQSLPPHLVPVWPTNPLATRRARERAITIGRVDCDWFPPVLMPLPSP